MRIPMIHIWSTLICLLLSLPTFACNCDPLSPNPAIEQADLIFQGTLIHRTTNWMSGGMKYTFRLDQSWKRGVDTVMFINSGWEQDCGFAFKDGEEYLVYAYKKFTWKTDRCTGTKLLNQAQADLQLLGEGMRPQKSSMISYMYWTIGGLTLVAGLFLAFVVLRKRK